eukprot:TRINITY_DN15432_c0_g1_i1.p1 TRINITY_DN15432_c0_g1~~TRINITY_DN15432_c0_g1_i1.p1  ORF type:complete len:115 (+),score=11.94 TRINITY_DN15432_c0_g1_i1:49-393(+)
MSSKTSVMKYTSFKDFYPFYLTEHSDPINRSLHFVGTTISILLLALILFTQSWNRLYIILLTGYGFAWVGHFFFEKNRPATFKYPFYSFAGDFKMWFGLLTGKLQFNPKKKPVF